MTASEPSPLGQYYSNIIMVSSEVRMEKVIAENDFSFLNYMNNYSYENLLIIEEKAQFKNRDQLAEYIGISKDTLKSWFSKKEDRRRLPPNQNWNYVLFQLEARRKGFDNLEQLVKSI